jgi:hypothetical protein
VEAIKALAEAGADLETNLGRTAMLGAAENDHFFAIKALMDAAPVLTPTAQTTTARPSQSREPITTKQRRWPSCKRVPQSDGLV